MAIVAVNDACLVFDHRLVVDLDHNTNDRHILAAGPLTKFSRSLYADDWSEYEEQRACCIYESPHIHFIQDARAVQLSGSWKKGMLGFVTFERFS